MIKHRTYAAINLDNIEYNYNSVRNKVAEGVRVLCVIKADAYGHGAAEIGRFLEGK
ncbi:MAG: alanine racemase, partial [Clostridia bacterium]|nr:alanine racemase [Clostridia bacterium]